MAWFNFSKKKADIQAKNVSSGIKSGLFQEYDINGMVHYLTIMPDLDETLQAAGILRRDLTRLETDDEISTALETRLLGVLSTPVTFESEDEASRLFIEAQLAPCLNDIIRNAWQAVPYGYSVMEAVYEKLADGKIGLGSMLYKPFWWFQPTKDGELTPYYQQQDTLDTRFKFFMTRRHASYMQPYGESVLSRLYWAWFYRQNGWEHWMRWLARYGTPPLVGTGNSHKLDELRQTLMASVNAAAIAVPEGTTITPINPTGGTQHFPEFEMAVTKRIQKMILGQTLTTDVGKSGSFAAAKVHDGVRDDKRLSDCKLVSRTVQHIIDAIITLNGLQPVIFRMEDARELNAERATRDATLVNANIVNLSREYLLRAYDFDEDDLDEKTPVTPPNTPVSGVKASLSGENLAFGAKKTTFTPAQQAIENLGDDVIRTAPNPISEDAIKMAIKSSSNADEMMNKLATLADGYDAPAFAELTERALFAADVFGYVKSEQGKV